MTARCTAWLACAVGILAGATAAQADALTGPLNASITTTRGTFGESYSAYGLVSMPSYSCSSAYGADSALSSYRGTFTIDGQLVPTVTWYPGVCGTNGVYSAHIHTPEGSILLPGTHTVQLTFGTEGSSPLASAEATITVDADAVVSGPAGTIELGLSTPSPGLGGPGSGTCTRIAATAGNAGDAGFPAQGPHGVGMLYGIVRMDATDCTWSSDMMLPTGPFTQRGVIGVAGNLPPGSVVWAYGPTRENAAAHWYALETSISGRYASFTLVDGGNGDDGLAEDHMLRTTLAIAAPASVPAPSYQDLWWAGSTENGWGLSVTQHGDVLFGALFIYDDQGEPRWLVMPGGAWNPEHTAYTANLYRPHGAPFYLYDAQSFVPGAPVGIATLAFTGTDTAVLTYSIDGRSGSKSLQRQRFAGPSSPLVMTAYGDLWWGGLSQNGWGFAVTQQGATLFGALFTYDENREPTWFVVPNLSLMHDLAFEASLYRTHASAWLGTAYDASKLSSRVVGKLRFTAASIRYTIDGHDVSSSLYRQPF